MNTADFIISSTYQEIAGTDDTVGQYESYSSFTLPGLYRVVSGVDCHDPKFNIVSPGADRDVFFPYDESDRRPAEVEAEMERLVYGDCPDDFRGSPTDRDKPLLFAMSRLDQVKNMCGFLEWYARSDELRELTNVLAVGGSLDPDDSRDRDERRQIEHMHRILDEHDLDGQVRWIRKQTDKNRVGALYRFVADTRGAFVQPALFEGFGLTVVEAMSSGLPVFATCHGGPREIVEDGVSGFHIDPHQPDESARTMADFFRRTRDDPDAWTEISRGARARVEERYTWRRYAIDLLHLSHIYGFWRYITSLERAETWRYLEMFYGLMYRRLAKEVPRAGGPGHGADVGESG
jgi:sucrose synthase